MISLFFFCLAAGLNACMDTIAHHYFDSKFKFYLNKDGYKFFWGHPDLSWKNKYIDRDPKKGKIKWLWGLMDKPACLTDAWHMFKSLMIVFICLSIVTFKPYLNYEFIPTWLQFILYVASYGLWWNVTFNLF